MGGEQPGGGKKRGRPRKIRTEDAPGVAAVAKQRPTPSPPPEVRRSGRQRRPRRKRDFADYGDEDDDFYWWELSSDEDAVVKKTEDEAAACDDVEPRKFRLLRKLPPQSMRRAECGGGSQSDGSGGSGKEEEDEAGGRNSVQEFDQPASVSTPLPDKKTLEAVLDKLQKKDIYGVYTEPVDPEELPDYHDIIKHPMDFGTIRKKLADGAYIDLESLESDVFLLCTNAMHYNAPDTIYYRQAHSIQELARKKFWSTRSTREESTKSAAKNLTAGPVDEAGLLSLAAPASNGDTSSGTCPLPANVSQCHGSISGNMDDEKSSRGEENSVKNPPKSEGKPEILYEDRRATFNLPVDQHSCGAHMPFSIFDDEHKRLVAVGLEGAQYPYSRSLARFAGPLGPTAWRIASQRIEQALPHGVGFGPGWVGDYEPVGQSPYLLNLADKQRGNQMADVSARVPMGPSGLANGKGAVPDGSGPEWLGFQKTTAFVQQRSTASTPGVSQIVRFGSQTDGGLGSIGSQGERFMWVGPLTSASQISQLTDARSGLTLVDGRLGQTGLVDQRFGQTLAGSSSRSPADYGFGQTSVSGSQMHNRAPADVRFGQNLSGNVNTVAHVDPRSFADGRFGQTLHAGYVSPGQSKESHGGHDGSTGSPVHLIRGIVEGPTKQLTSRKSAVGVENPNLPMRSNPIDAVTTAAPTRMSIGRSLSFQATPLPPPPPSLPPQRLPGSESNFLNTEGRGTALHESRDESRRLYGSTGGEENWTQNKNLLGFSQVNRHGAFPRQACWQGLTPHGQEQKSNGDAPDLNVSFLAPGLPAQQPPGIRVDPSQPDLALQL